jgi:hypothetical protein
VFTVTLVTFTARFPGYIWRLRAVPGVAMRVNILEIVMATVFGLIATALLTAGVMDLLSAL